MSTANKLFDIAPQGVSSFCFLIVIGIDARFAYWSIAKIPDNFVLKAAFIHINNRIVLKLIVFQLNSVL